MIQIDGITLYQGNCLDVLATLPEASVDFVITDPPYLLNFMGQDWDKTGGDLPTNELVFRSWFAGLVAGEGCFTIVHESLKNRYVCHFGIKMRADEGPLLRALCRRVGAGLVREESPSPDAVIHSSLAVRWEVSSREDCWKIASLLDGTPLFAKKQREYDVWRRALQVWTDKPRGNRWHGPSDQSQMVALWQEMKTLRPFDQELANADFDPLRQPDYLFHNRWAKACLRVVKPGGLLLAFGGTRTYHRLTCAIEDAGWEIRDALMWLYGQGMPKCHDIGKMIDKAKGAVREVVGTKLGRPGYSLANHGRTNEVYGDLHNPEAECAITAPATPEAAKWTGWAMALKPAWEPIVLAMKPMDGTIANNALTWGVAGMNIEDSRVGTESTVRTRGDSLTVAGWASTKRSPVGGSECGRWPANVLLDEEVAAQLDEQTGRLSVTGKRSERSRRAVVKGTTWNVNNHLSREYPNDSGGASRFFYTAKATKKERGEGNDHPTVKPLALMEYLLTLLSSPDGGLILDPFAGSGSTLVAARRQGRQCIGIELDHHNYEIATQRIAHAVPGSSAD
jgi:site-specific DNA-methyltransferase (adenine-specific)